jgi:hypothetical protein
MTEEVIIIEIDSCIYRFKQGINIGKLCGRNIKEDVYCSLHIPKKNKQTKMSFCLTCGEQSENSVGMEKIGKGLLDKGYSIDEIKKIEKEFNNIGGKSEYIEMNCDEERGAVLVMRNGANVLLKNIGIENGSKKILEEMKELEWDKKAWSRGSVKNKIARWNLCFSDKGRESDIENKKGTIISYDDIKITKLWKDEMEKLCGETIPFEMEGNNYYDVEKCYIGFHGDGERKKASALNISDEGVVREIRWRWFQNSKRIGDEYIVKLYNGDMYIMSEKASGFDWLKRSKKTLRHGAAIEGSKMFKK